MRFAAMSKSPERATLNFSGPGFSGSGGQSVGAAAGNMIAIHNVVAASATVGILGKEGNILRITIIPTIYYLILTGIIGLLLVHIFKISDQLVNI